MTKRFVILSTLIALVVFPIAGLRMWLGGPYDPAQSTYLDMEPPNGLVRTIVNERAGHSTTFLKKAAEKGWTRRAPGTSATEAGAGTAVATTMGWPTR